MGGSIIPTTDRVVELVRRRGRSDRRARTVSRSDHSIPPKLSPARFDIAGDQLVEKLAADHRSLCVLDLVGDGTSYTLEEVGAALGVTRERVRQIELSALQTLRAQTAELE